MYFPQGKKMQTEIWFVSLHKWRIRFGQCCVTWSVPEVGFSFASAHVVWQFKITILLLCCHCFYTLLRQWLVVNKLKGVESLPSRSVFSLFSVVHSHKANKFLLWWDPECKNACFVHAALVYPCCFSLFWQIGSSCALCENASTHTPHYEVAVFYSRDCTEHLKKACPFFKFCAIVRPAELPYRKAAQWANHGRIWLNSRNPGQVSLRTLYCNSFPSTSASIIFYASLIIGEITSAPWSP